MPRKFRKGGESRLSLEGLAGEVVDGKRVQSIKAHGERRRSRTVRFWDGTRKDFGIYSLVGWLIKSR